MSKFNNIVSFDVLIVGGGMAGLYAANKVLDLAPELDVLVVDKAYASGGGMANRGGNGILVLPEEPDAVDKYVEYGVHNIFEYLQDQEMAKIVASNINPSTKDLIKWGVKVSHDENGELYTFPPAGGAPWRLCAIEMISLKPLRRRAVEGGVKFTDNTQITGLLKDGDKIAGAAGFNLLDGSFNVFRAKTVMLATGSCGYKCVSMFIGSGEGNMLAFHAGARMRNAEFGNFMDVYAIDKGNTIYGSDPFVCNSKGENLWNKYIDWPAPGQTPPFYRGFYKEYLAGDGPMYVDMQAFVHAMHASEDWKYMGQSFAAAVSNDDKDTKVRFFKDKIKYIKVFDEREAEFVKVGDKPEVKIGMHGNTGAISVGHDCQTTIPGLFAAGADVHNGSCFFAAFSQPALQRGGGVGNAIWTASIAAPHVVETAKSAATPKTDEALLQKIHDETFSYMRNEKGADPHDLIEPVQDQITPLNINLIREEKRLAGAIDELARLRKEVLPKMRAADFHSLKLCHEVMSMAKTGELMARSAILRTESRGSHMREDYIDRDDKNWLKWIVADNVSDEFVFSTEDIPINRYKYQPKPTYILQPDGNYKFSPG